MIDGVFFIYRKRRQIRTFHKGICVNAGHACGNMNTRQTIALTECFFSDGGKCIGKSHPRNIIAIGEDTISDSRCSTLDTNHPIATRRIRGNYQMRISASALSGNHACAVTVGSKDQTYAFLQISAFTANII